MWSVSRLNETVGRTLLEKKKLTEPQEARRIPSEFYRLQKVNRKIGSGEHREK